MSSIFWAVTQLFPIADRAIIPHLKEEDEDFHMTPISRLAVHGVGSSTRTWIFKRVISFAQACMIMWISVMHTCTNTEEIILPNLQAWKISLVTHTTMGPHLAHCHLIIANNANLAPRLTLAHNHPIRRVLKIFTYNTSSINYAATLFLTKVC